MSDKKIVNNIDLDSLSEKQMNVSKEHINFDLERFMNNTWADDGAVLVITPSQFVMTNCFEKGDYDDFFVHEDTGIAIYSSIYGDFEKNSSHMISDVAVNDGNIYGFLRSGYCLFAIINIPDVISQSQYNFLVVFNQMIKDICDGNKYYFDNNPMRFSVGDNSGNNYEGLKNMDSILLELKNRIGDVQVKKEFIIGDSIENLDVSKDNSHLFMKNRKLRK